VIKVLSRLEMMNAAVLVTDLNSPVGHPLAEVTPRKIRVIPMLLT